MAEPSTISLRQRTAADTPALIDILTRVYESSGYPLEGPSIFEGFIDPPADDVLHSIVATVRPTDASAADQIIGTATLLRPSQSLNHLASRLYVTEHGGTLDDHATFGRFFVDPALQSKGAGNAMVLDCLRWSNEHGIRLVLIMLEKNTTAMRLYERHGFVKIGESVYPSNDGIVHRSPAYLGPEVRQERVKREEQTEPS